MMHSTLTAMLLVALSAGAETPLHRGVTVNYQDRDIGEVLKDLAEKAGVTFACPAPLLDGQGPVTYVAKEQEAGRIATRILRPRRLRIAAVAGNRVTVEKLDPVDEFKVKRAEVFEFAEKPTGGESCTCIDCRPALDYFARSFVPEMEHYTVGVLDTNGNLITRIGRYGNVDDGMPLVKAGGPENPRSVGGDEVALFNPAYLATDTDRRLFIGDNGNVRILSVPLDYHATSRIALKDAQDRQTGK